jgi:Skp family chaperone for outer membrane proteins
MSLSSTQQSSAEDLYNEIEEEVLQMSVQELVKYIQEFMRKTGYTKYTVQDIVYQKVKDRLQ